jgi:hypothetical protein
VLTGRTREDLIRRQVDAYSQVRGNLAKQAAVFRTSEQLPAVAATGQPSCGMDAVGDGKQSYAETHTIWTDNLYNRDTVDVDGTPSLVAYRRAIITLQR